MALRAEASPFVPAAAGEVFGDPQGLFDAQCATIALLAKACAASWRGRHDNVERPSTLGKTKRQLIGKIADLEGQLKRIRNLVVVSDAENERGMSVDRMPVFRAETRAEVRAVEAASQEDMVYDVESDDIDYGDDAAALDADVGESECVGFFDMDVDVGESRFVGIFDAVPQDRSMHDVQEEEKDIIKPDVAEFQRLSGEGKTDPVAKQQLKSDGNVNVKMDTVLDRTKVNGQPLQQKMWVRHVDPMPCLTCHTGRILKFVGNNVVVDFDGVEEDCFASELVPT